MEHIKAELDFIPVVERLPEDRDFYLGALFLSAHPYGRVPLAFAQCNTQGRWHDPWGTEIDITHWADRPKVEAQLNVARGGPMMDVIAVKIAQVVADSLRYKDDLYITAFAQKRLAPLIATELAALKDGIGAGREMLSKLRLREKEFVATGLLAETDCDQWGNRLKAALGQEENQSASTWSNFDHYRLWCAVDTGSGFGAWTEITPIDRMILAKETNRIVPNWVEARALDITREVRTELAALKEENERLDEAVRAAILVIESLPKGALGQDPFLGHSFRDAFADKLKAALGQEDGKDKE